MYMTTAFKKERRSLSTAMFAVSLGIALLFEPALAQNNVDFRVDEPSQRLEMVVNTSRILSMDNEVPRVLVNNRDVLRVVPLSPNQVQVSAVKPGVTQVNLWQSDGTVRSVDVVVYADARQLDLVLQSEFPRAAIRVRPLENSVVLTGYVERPEEVNRIVTIAEDYYPKVINNISVGGVQQVCLHVKVMEVSRTKLRSLGMDWAYFTGNDFVINSAGGLISAVASGAFGAAGEGLDTVQFGIIDGTNQFNGFIDALRQNNVIKVLAEPTLVTVSGRPASFNEGGEFPIIVPQSLGVQTVEFKQFGTRVDFVPIVLGNGNIRLEVRPQVSEIDESRGVDVNGILVPGLRSRWVDTGVEMRAGQTLALAGLIQTLVEGENRGIPYLADIPWVGNFFGRSREQVNEIELLVTVRPELVSALEPHQAPRVNPGEHTTSPADHDFYGRRYMEVPKCCPDPRCDNPQGPGVPYGATLDAAGAGPAAEYGVPVDSAVGPQVDYGLEPSAAPLQGSGSRSFAPAPNQGTVAPGTGVSGGAVNGGTPEIFGPTGYDDLGY